MKELILLALLLLVSCGKVDFNPGNSFSLGGRILPLHTVSAIPSFFIRPAYASLTCHEKVMVKLHRVLPDGSLDPVPSVSTLALNGVYSLDQKDLPSDLEEEKVRYQIVVNGCDEVLYRPVTGINEKQDVSYASTIVGLSTQISLSKPLSEVRRVEVEELINQIKGEGLIHVYNNLKGSSELSARFQEIFLDNPEKLAEAHPSVSLLSFNGLLSEGLPQTFKVSAVHFDPAYDVAYEWLLDGELVSSLNQWVFSPSADGAGEYLVTAIVGQRDEDNPSRVNRSKPFYVYSHAVSVLNTLPASAPAFTVENAVSNDGSFIIKIETGPGRENCGSFQSFMITHSPTKPSSSHTGFTKTCTEEGEQIESVSVTGTDGAYKLFLWVKDRNGLVSESAAAQDIQLDRSGPELELSHPGSLLKGGKTIGLTLAASDSVTGVSKLKLQYASNGVNFNIEEELTPGMTSFNWSVPLDNTSVAKLRLYAEDGAGNVTTLDTASFVIDSLAPEALDIILLSSTPTRTSTIELQVGSCTDRSKVLINESALTPTGAEVQWQDCAEELTYSVSSGDGVKTVYAWAKDEAGNVSTASSVSLTLDQTPPSAPAVTFTSNSMTLEKKKTSSTVLSVSSCTDTKKVLISTSSSTPVPSDPKWQECTLTPGSIPFLLDPAVEGNHSFRAWAIDEAGNISASTSLNFIYDVTPPQITSIQVNNGGEETGNNNTLIDLEVTSGHEDITSFCLKYNDSVAPVENDHCWVDLESINYQVTDNLKLNDYPFQIGTILGMYDIRVWVRDDLGNMSTMTDILDKDMCRISYLPDPPPVISNVIASSTDLPNDPLTSADTTVVSGSDVYVRWKITDNNAIPDGNISLFYSEDDTHYTLITSGLSNTSNGGCTVDGNSTGCFKWASGSPLSSFYKIKVEVLDSGVATVFAMTNALNTGNVNFLSGNTSLGIGGSASSAILLGKNEHTFNDNADPHAIAVTKNGYIFFNYRGKGLTYVSPEDGLLKVLIPQTGVISGNGGEAKNATLRSLWGIILDYEGNLLLWDANEIRKIDLSSTPWKITKVFGGGSDHSDGALGIDAYLSTNGYLFTTTPNGRIYFAKTFSSVRDIWFYDPEDKRVKRFLTLGGLGTWNMVGPAATYDNSTCPEGSLALGFELGSSGITKIIRKMGKDTTPECGNSASWLDYNTSFNVMTGQAEAPHPPSLSFSSLPFSGMDGKIYVLEQGRVRLRRYNPVTNVYEVILGNGTNGRCEDGTLALECSSVIMSAFINEFGQVYFLDMGVIRMIDREGKVRTLAGQPRNYGIGENPQSARYPMVDFFSVMGNEIYVTNKLERQIVKFSLDGGSLGHVAGTGIGGNVNDGDIAVLSPLPTCGWQYPCGLITDQARNRLYQYNGGATNVLSYIDLTAGKWVTTTMPGWGTPRSLSYLGVAADKALVFSADHSSANGVSTRRINLRSVNLEDFTFQTIYGTNEYLTNTELASYDNICSGQVGTECRMRDAQNLAIINQYKFDLPTESWLINYRGKRTIHALPDAGGVVSILDTANVAIMNFDHLRVGSDHFFFYCGSDGKLYRRNLTTKVETLLPLPTNSMKCGGHALHYHEERDSLMFIYNENDMSGIAEYKNPLP